MKNVPHDEEALMGLFVHKGHLVFRFWWDLHMVCINYCVVGLGVQVVGKGLYTHDSIIHMKY